MGACQLDTQHFLLGYELTKEKDITKGFSCWTRPLETNNLCVIPAENIALSETAAYARVHCKDNEKRVSLLQG